MSQRISPPFAFAAAIALVPLFTTACVLESDDELTDDELGQVEEGINGGLTIPEANSGYIKLGSSVGSCSGTLMSNAWVLTAKHCVGPADVGMPSNVSATMAGQFRTGAQITLYPNDDVAIIRLNQPFVMNGSQFGFVRHLYPFATNTIAQGTDLTCRGYGNFNDDANTGFGTLRLAVLPVRGVHFTWWGYYFDLGIDMNAAGQFLAHGDSGTSCLIPIAGGEQVVTGVQSTGYHGLDGRIANMISPETFRPWFSTFESLWTPAYQGLGAPAGGVASSPAVASMQQGRLDVFARGNDNAVWWSVRNGTTPSPWIRLAPESVSSDPAAISWGPGRMDVVARGTDGGYWLKSFTGSTWSGWGGLGGWFQTGPAIASRGPGLLDVFGRGGDNAVWMKSWNGSSWSGWSQIAPNQIAHKPAVIKSGPNQLDLFVVGNDSQMWTTRFNGTSWSAWTGLGGSFTSSPTVTSPLPGQLELYGRGQDGALWVATFVTSWTGWRQVLPAQIAGDQASVSPPNSVRSDVVVRGLDNNVYVLETSGF